MGRRIVIAIGGNSLIKDGNHLAVEDQYEAICQTAGSIARLCRDNRVLVTHGNGPQVGFILRRSDIAHERDHMHRVPLVSCDADTQGAIGYQIQQALDNEFRSGHTDKKAVTLITQVLVDADDPAFSSPAKPIGSFYTKAQADILMATNGDWRMKEDAGRGFRRVVPSPRPVSIVEFDAIKTLYDQGFVLLAAGGGGIPVIEEEGRLKGVDAVIDKDRASALLAGLLESDILVISTAVRQVALNYGTAEEKMLGRVDRKTMKGYLREGHFAEGSMKPKVEAALDFLEKGGKEAVITDPEHLEAALEDRDGTRIY